MVKSTKIPKFKVSACTEEGWLVLKFKWPLPEKDDKEAIKAFTNQLELIVMKAGGSVGQMNAVSKNFRTAGFHIKGPKK